MLIYYKSPTLKALLSFAHNEKYIPLQTDYFGGTLRTPSRVVLIVAHLAVRHG